MAPQLEERQGSPHRRGDGGNGDSFPLRFSSLPPEIHLRIMSYLNYREVQFLRATNSYVYNLLSPTDLAHFRDAYAETLYQDELDAITNPLTDNEYVPTGSPDDLEIRRRHEKYLTCFFCFRIRHISHFAASQCTQRRTKGHIHAKKRFCEDCGVERGKWEPGTELQFRFGQRVYCLRCRRVRSTAVPNVHVYRPRSHQGVCEACLLELEEDYTGEQITGIIKKLARKK